jgi:hypothetical protein
MSKPFSIFLLAMAGLLLAVLAYHHSISSRQNAPVQASTAVTAPGKSNAAATPFATAKGVATDVLRLRPDQVLAMVNDHAIKLGDVIPVTTNGSQVEISLQDMKFFLKRAVDRELIFETAKQQGVTLNDAQNQQLANLNSMRNLPEPGGIAKLNSSWAQRELEMEDAQAFMLQTTLMAAQGASPNVTEPQVEAYYLDHQSQYGELPVDDTARAQAWAKIDFQIRQELAAATRTSYNDKLAAYMNQMESSAKIEMTALDQSPVAPPE